MSKHELLQLMEKEKEVFIQRFENLINRINDKNGETRKLMRELQDPLKGMLDFIQLNFERLYENQENIMKMMNEDKVTE
jgi:hypothetical protein